MADVISFPRRIMPAIRKFSTPSSSSPSLKKTTIPGWSKEQKSALFHHVITRGETAWSGAVEGKTGHQSQEQWKKTLLPFIKRTCGL